MCQMYLHPLGCDGDDDGHHMYLDLCTFFLSEHYLKEQNKHVTSSKRIWIVLLSNGNGISSQLIY